MLTPARSTEAGASKARRSFLHVILRVPLFHKLLLANAAILALVAAMAAAFAARAADGQALIPLDTGLLVIGIGVLLSLIANGVIVWVALSPLRHLEETAARVRAGDFDVRASVSALADTDLERLVITFNDVLDTAADRNRRLREMAARATAASEEERRRVARELHDGIAQTLAALNLRIRLARGAADPQLRAATLDEVSGGISDAILELRRMARGLRPPALEMLGLGAAIASHAESVGETTGIIMRMEADAVSGLLTPDGELSLYRILQEGLSNVVRHSGASQVDIGLKRRGRTVTLTVADNGRGFEPGVELRQDRGLGLFGMRERAAMMGGVLTVESSSGAGTRIEVSVPVQDEIRHG